MKSGPIASVLVYLSKTLDAHVGIADHSLGITVTVQTHIKRGTSLHVCRVKSRLRRAPSVCLEPKFPSLVVFILEPNLNKTELL